MESAVRLPPSSINDRGESVTDDAALLKLLFNIVGRSHVLTGMERTRRFCTGFRFGHGPVVAVVRPGTLVEQWRVLKACVAANKIVIMQAANTGLTGGSTPDGNDYDRGIILINTMRITGIHLINEGKQVVCCPVRRSISSRIGCGRWGGTLTP
jgi:D-lactate dehydrogenase (quinone)